MKRLPGTGVFARTGALSAFSFITASILAFLSSGGGGAWTIAAAFQVFGTVIAFRSLFVGVYFDESGVRLVSWIKSYRFEWSAVRRSDAVAYFGFLSKASDTNLLSMIRVTLSDDRIIELQSTVGFPRAVRRQASALNRLVQDRR